MRSLLSYSQTLHSLQTFWSTHMRENAQWHTIFNRGYIPQCRVQGGFGGCVNTNSANPLLRAMKVFMAFTCTLFPALTVILLVTGADGEHTCCSDKVQPWSDHCLITSML